MAATPIKRPNLTSAVRSSAPQLLVLLLVSVSVFLFGLLLGVQLYDHGTSGNARTPWLAFTKQKFRIPPGVNTAGIRGAAVDAPQPSAAAVSQHEESNTAISLLSLSTTGPSNFVVLEASKGIALSSSADAKHISFSAWIYFDSRKPSNTINMIAANRHSGCSVDDRHRGWSFFVNNWQTSDRSLILEWQAVGGADGGCARLVSEPKTVPMDRWVHVGFALTAAEEGVEPQALLFMDGELLRAATVSRKLADVQPDDEVGVRLTIGASPDGQFGFKGKIGQVAIVHNIVSPKQLYTIGSALTLAGFSRVAADAGGSVRALLVLSNMPLEVAEEDADAVSSRAGIFLFDAAKKTQLYGAKKASDASLSVIAPVLHSPPFQRSQPLPLKNPDIAKLPPDSIRRGPIPGTLSDKAIADFTKGGNQWVQAMIRTSAETSEKIDDPKGLASGLFSDDVTVEQLVQSDEEGRHRAESVKAAMAYAWQHYKKHAWGFDELKPRSASGQDNWGGLGMTLVDSLDTLWLMGMMEEFEEAKQWVAENLRFDRDVSISVFEVTIRELGGLLSAYELSGEVVFLQKAQELADALLPAFDTPTGIPRSTIVLGSGHVSSAGWTGGSSILAELGTLQVEFRRLAKATQNNMYARKVEQVIERLDALHPSNGLYPIYISADSGQAGSSQVTFGALGDSFYEYLIKVWIQGGKSEPMYRRMYDTAMRGLTDHLLKKSRPSELLYVADYDGGSTIDKMDHLACFVPGMLALGAFTSAGTAGEQHAATDLKNAKALMYTCWQMYDRMRTGISPEFVEFPGGRDLQASDRAPFYILRPEAAESLFILHQLTGNPIYREWGWKMFQAIDRYCKLEYGYGAHPDVRDTSRTPDDRMESFFLAETLKYLYLLQSPDHPISLERFVFNTEAHPLKVFPEL